MAFNTNSGGDAIRDFAFDDTFNLITIMMWIMPVVNGTIYVYEKRFEFNFRVIGTSGSTMRMAYFSDYTGGGSNDGNWESSNDSVTQNVPVHVAVSQDRDGAGAAIIYIDGVADTTEIDAPAGGKRTSGSQHQMLNAWAEGSAFEGRSADIRCYNRILTPEEIETIVYMRGGDGFTDGLQARGVGNELSPGTTVGDGEMVDLSTNAFDFDSLGTFTYEDDPFGINPSNTRRFA